MQLASLILCRRVHVCSPLWQPAGAADVHYLATDVRSADRMLLPVSLTCYANLNACSPSWQRVRYLCGFLKHLLDSRTRSGDNSIHVLLMVLSSSSGVDMKHDI